MNQRKLAPETRGVTHELLHGDALFFIRQVRKVPAGFIIERLNATINQRHD